MVLDEKNIASEDIIRVEGEYYILATSSLADNRNRVLKHGDTFALFDRYGDIQPVGLGEQGLYHTGTRFLSRLELRLGDVLPLLLSSTVDEENAVLTVDLTNPDLQVDAQLFMPRDTLHLLRSTFLWDGTCYERIVVRNYALEAFEVTLSLRFDAGFADIFEVRGMKRQRKGTFLDRVVDENSVVLGYEGLDGVIRRTRFECSPSPQEVSAHEMRFTIRLRPHEEEVVFLTISTEIAAAASPRLVYDAALTQATQALRRYEQSECAISTSNEPFNDWLQRAQADMHMMITETPEGPYPYAGVPEWP